MELSTRVRCICLLFFGLLLGSLSACGGGSSASVPANPALPSGGCNANGSGTVVLSWTPPSTNQDGSPTTLAEYRIYCAADLAHFQQVATAGATDTMAVIETVSSGTTFFSVTAVNTTGLESGFSDIQSITIEEK
jgi:hypothetical protein